MLAKIDARNATWEGELTRLNAQLWQNMKAIGVRAYWRDPFQGQPGRFAHLVLDAQGKREELYEFIVEYKDLVLTKRTRQLLSSENIEAGALIVGANKLVAMGIKVVGWNHDRHA